MMAGSTAVYCMLAVGAMLSQGAARRLLQDKCGQPARFSPRIAHGLDAEPGRHPYMASLQSYNLQSEKLQHFCGGVLVAPNYVLTAAHCVSHGKHPFPAVVIGTTELDTLDGMLNGMQQDFTTCRTIIHEGYDDDSGQDDLALIQISQDSSIYPIKVNKEKVGPGRTVRALGWGSTETQRFSNMLQQLETEVLSNQECQKRFRQAFPTCQQCGPKIVEEMVCAQSNQRADVCKGDSGGPIVLNPGNGEDESPCDDLLVGITSMGFRCEDIVKGLRYPGIFTRVSEYASWIENLGEKKSRVLVNPDLEETCYEMPQEAADSRYPYIVSIQNSRRHICGGVLVAPDLVLTAAECLELEEFPKVMIGATFRSYTYPRNGAENVEKFSVCRTIQHEKYTEDPVLYNLALLEISGESAHDPISISNGVLDVDQVARVVGWGSKEGRPRYADLRWLETQITPDGSCGKRIAVDIVPTFQDAHGLPLIQVGEGDDPSSDALFGIATKQSECLSSNNSFSYPGVFTQISEFGSWIRDRGAGQPEKLNPDKDQCFRFDPTCVFLFGRWIGNNCAGKPGHEQSDP